MDESRQYFRFEPSGTFGVISASECNILYQKNMKEVISGTLESFSSWNIRTGVKTKSWNDLDNKSQVTCMQSSPVDLNILAAGYDDGSVRIWNLESDESIIVFRGHKTAVSALAFDATGARLASGSRDTDIVLWDLSTETGIFRLRGHNNLITGIKFIDENHILSSSKDTLMKLWDLQAMHCVETIVNHRAEVSSFFLTQDNNLLVTAGADQFLRIFKIDWTALENKLKASSEVSSVFTLMGEVQKSSKDRALQVSYNSEFNLFAVLSNDRSVEVFRFSTTDDVKKKLQRRRKRQKEKMDKSDDLTATADMAMDPASVAIESNDLIKSIKHFRLGSRARSFAFGSGSLSDGKIRFAFGMSTNSIEEWDINFEEDGEPERIASVDIPGHRGDIKLCAISSDSSMVLTGSIDGVKIWNTSSGSCIRTWECENVLCASFVKRNEYVIAGTKDGTLRIFELSSGTELDPVEAHSGAIWSLALRPDQKGFATGSADKIVKFWEFKTSSHRAEGFKLKNIRSLQMSDDVLYVKYSPDCRLIAVSLLDLTVKVFFEDSLKFYLNLFGHKLPILSIDISHDSRMIATASADKNVKLWGLDFGDCRKSVFAHQDAITAVSFLPNSYQFITASKDGLVKYWTDEQYSLLQKLEGHKNEVWSFALASRGQLLVTVSSDQSIRLWRRSDEQIFLEEEREAQMEELLEKSLLDDRKEHNDGKNQDEVGEAAKRSLDTLRASERLADAIDAADEEIEKWQVYEEQKLAGHLAAPEPIPGPYFLSVAKGKFPAQLVLETFGQIPAVELEMALLSLPFTHIKSLFGYIETWLMKNMNIGLTSRILASLIRLYFNQIIADGKLRIRLEQIRDLQKSKLTDFRDLLSLNSQYVKTHIKHYTQEHSKIIS